MARGSPKEDGAFIWLRAFSFARCRVGLIGTIYLYGVAGGLASWLSSLLKNGDPASAAHPRRCLLRTCDKIIGRRFGRLRGPGNRRAHDLEGVRAREVLSFTINLGMGLEGGRA